MTKISINNKNKKTICIVGCGMAGGILAVELIKKNKFNVLIIDSDQLRNNFNNKITYNKFPYLNTAHRLENKGSHALRAFGFGGSSNLWSGVITVLEKSDLDKIDKIAGSKITKDLIKNYSKANYYFNINYNWIKKIIKKLTYNIVYKIIIRSNFFLRKNFFVQTMPLRIRSKILDLTKSNTNLKIVENAQAITVSSNKLNSKNIEFVEVLIQNKLERIYADIFVFSCGSLETPRLFLQSIFQKKLNIKNKNIGKNLIDHPLAVIGDISSKKNNIRLKYFDIFLSLFKRKIKYRLGFSLKDTKNGNHCIVLKPEYKKNYINFKNDIRNIFNNNLFLINAINILQKNSFLRIINYIIFFFYERLPFAGPLSKSAQIFCYLEQLPSHKSFVRLSRKINDHRIVPTINWHVGHKEIREFDRISNFLNKLFKKSKYFYKPRKITFSQISTGSHHAGTMRISKNSESGVVDKNLKIHNLNNAYVCDASILPFYGNSNPSYTLAAFAIRLSNFLDKSS